MKKKSKRIAKFYSSPITINPDFCSSTQSGQCFSLTMAGIWSSSTEDTRSGGIIFSKAMNIITFPHLENENFLWLILKINFFENSRVVWYKANKTESTMWLMFFLSYLRTKVQSKVWMCTNTWYHDAFMKSLFGKKKNHTETNHINFLKFWFHYAHLDWDLCFSLFGEPYEGQRARTWEHLQFISQLKRLKILVSCAVIPCISISAFVCQSKALLAIINFLFNTLKAGNIYENNFHYFWHSNVQVFS